MKHASAIYAHCCRFLLGTAAARDATQESFARVIARGMVPMREEDALCYLYRVSANICINILRRQRVETRATAMLTAILAGHRAAEPAMADRDFVIVVLARSGKLGAQVAIMHYLEGRPQVEIAKMLGVARRTVFNRLRRVGRIAEELLQPRSQSEVRKNRRGRADTEREVR